MICILKVTPLRINGQQQIQHQYLQSLYFPQALQHQFPEVAHVHLLAHRRVESLVHEVAVCPPPRRTHKLYLHQGLPRHEVSLPQQIVDGARVMSHWEIKVLPFLISFLKVSKQGSQLLAEGGSQLTELSEHILSGQDSMGYFERHHGDGNARVKYDVSCFRIDQDIELSCWTPVPQAYGSSHYSNPPYFWVDVGEGLEDDGQVGHGSSYNKVHAILLFHNLVVDVQEGLVLDGLLGRLQQLGSFQSTFSMNVRGYLQFATKRVGRPLHDLDVCLADFVENVEGVLGGIFDEGVASRGGDADEVNFFREGSHDDGEHVVVAWVAVQPNFLPHPILSIIAQHIQLHEYSNILREQGLAGPHAGHLQRAQIQLRGLPQFPALLKPQREEEGEEQDKESGGDRGGRGVGEQHNKGTQL